MACFKFARHRRLIPYLMAAFMLPVIPHVVLAQGRQEPYIPPDPSQSAGSNQGEPGYQQGQYGQSPYSAAPQSYGGQPPYNDQQYAQPQAQPYGGGQPQYGFQPQQPYGGNGFPPPQNYMQPQQPYGGAPQYQGSVSYAQAGTVMPAALKTSISTQVAKAGDYIEAQLTQPIPLGGAGSIPAGSVVSGQITEAKAGGRLSRSGALSIAFNQLRLPSGVSVPITAHIVGGVGKYNEKGNGTMRGEGMTAKLGQGLLRGGLGAGLGAGLGTAVGAIAGGGHGAGMGAWSGAAIGGGVGVADMLLRKGRDVVIPSGTPLQVQLDQAVSIPEGGGPSMPTTGVF